MISWSLMDDNLGLRQRADRLHANPFEKKTQKTQKNTKKNTKKNKKKMLAKKKRKKKENWNYW